MKTLNISQVDSVFADGSYPIEMLFFYEHKLKTSRIRSALKKLATDFWPLFGEYQTGQIYFDRYTESECFDEEALDQQFESTETNSTFFEKYSRFNPLTMKKLLHLKIIQYINGTVLIPKMNHLAGDGYSYFYFLTALAAMMRGNSIPFKTSLTRLLYRPHHRRTILREFLFGANELKPLVPDSRFTVKFDEIPKDEVRSAIKDIKLHFDTTVSANDLLSAMAIKKIVLLQPEYFQETIQLTIPMDVRRQIAEYGQKYFGNALLFAVINFETKTIQESGTNEIAVEIRKSMPAITKAGYIKYLTELEQLIAVRHFDKLKPYDPRHGCLVTNLSKLPTDKLNFGSGVPDFIFPLTIEKNSAALLTHKNNFLLRLAY